jgi:hypothetical protein
MINSKKLKRGHFILFFATLVALVIVFFTVNVTIFASDFARLDEALPRNVDAKSIAPVFDFDGDGALPASGISRSGEQNQGLKPTGKVGGDCRSDNFLDESNTMHRYASIVSEGSTYCGHFYALYFEKDQTQTGIYSGHRHDWEYVAIWTKDGKVTHGSYSAHGKLNTESAENIPSENGHLKFVYHKEGASTHAMRFAKKDEVAENPYGKFVTPEIASWYTFHGDNVDNAKMRDLMNNFDYGSANFPNTDRAFLDSLNNFKPSEYPTFTKESTAESIEESNEEGSEINDKEIDKWEAGKDYKKDNLVLHEGKHYVCILDHFSQQSAPPDYSNTLWKITE